MRVYAPKVRFSGLLLAGMMACAGCATSPQGRMQLTAPAPVSDVYSIADMQFHLATAANVDTPCKEAGCSLNGDFDRQVQQLGSRLAVAAFEAYPDLAKRVSQFEFVVAEKAEPGTDSSAAGKVIIYRGVQNLHLDEVALAFVMAREMGHVISRHHDEKAATRLLFSVAAGVLFPALNLFTGSAALAQASSITSSGALATTAASTATSFIGSKVALDKLKPQQLSEADSIAISLLEKQGWDKPRVARAVASGTQVEGYSSWAKDYRISVAHMKAIDEAAGAQMLASQTGSPDPRIEQAPTHKAVPPEPLGTDVEQNSFQVGLVSEADQNPKKDMRFAEVADISVDEAGFITLDASTDAARIEQTHLATADQVDNPPDVEAAKSDTAVSIPGETSQVVDKVVASDKNVSFKGAKSDFAGLDTPVMFKTDMRVVGSKGARQQTGKFHLASAKLAKKFQPVSSKSKQVVKVKSSKAPIIASRGAGKAIQVDKVVKVKSAMDRNTAPAKTKPFNAELVVAAPANKQGKLNQDLQQRGKATLALNTEIGKSKKTTSSLIKKTL